MMFWEILIDGVFVAALLTGIACLVYVVYATILERRLLRARRGPRLAVADGAAARMASSPAAASPSTSRDSWHRGAGSPALHESRG